MSRTRRFFPLLAVFLSMIFVLSCFSGVEVFAAESPFLVNVGDKVISFQKNGRTTGSYRMSRNDVVLVTDSSDDLLVCFYNTDGQYVGVTLGDQDNVALYGSMDSLVLHRDLDRNVIIGTSCSVSDVTVNAPVKVSVYGNIDSIDIASNASVIAVKGSRINNAVSSSSLGSLTIKDGAVVKNTYIGDDSGIVNISDSNSEITFRTDIIYADYGDRLRDYSADLQASVRAYYNKKRITGEVEWTLSGSTAIKKTGSYRFRFIPDKSSLDTAYGTVRIVVDDENTDLTELDLDIRSITVEYNTNTLSDLTTKLRQNVTAYDVYGKRVPGTLRWINENTKVSRSGYYDFMFIPNSNKYANVRDSIKIQIENEELLGDDGQVSLDVVDIDTTSTRKRLRNFTTQLQSSVTAYDPNTGEEVPGKVSWVDNGMTLVTETEEFEFRFVPSDKRYQRTYGTIIIYVDD